MPIALSKRTFLMAAGAFTAFGASSLLLRRFVHADERGGGGPSGLEPTPAGQLGPFYPVEHPIDTDFDLTRMRGDSGPRAAGEVLEISGRVLARDGTPEANARVELWQANAAGRYAHPGDTRADAPLDPNFQGYADLHTDAQGAFRILTVRPGLYPVGGGLFERSPHIHFDVRGRRRRLVTQMYFDDTDPKILAQDKVIEQDLWGRPTPLPSTIFAKRQGAGSYRFDIVL